MNNGASDNLVRQRETITASTEDVLRALRDRAITQGGTGLAPVVFFFAA